MRIISGKARGTKLYTLEGLATRPTLDRVKESMFNIIQNEIANKVVLDLFAGSGAIGLEFLSRGANKVIMCDSSKEAIKVIKKNIEKTHSENEIELYNIDFKGCLKKIENEKLDIIYLDPPYDTDFIKQSLEEILKLKLINEDTLIIIETDDKEKILKEIPNFNVIDTRKYGIVHIIFLKLEPKERS